MAKERTVSVRSKIRLEGSASAAIEAVIEGMPKDAIVRGDDDGLGRFAGDRTVVIRGKDGDRLLMFRGSYGAIKSRLHDPHLDVLFKTGKRGATARLRREIPQPKGIGTHIMDLLGQIVTVAALVVVYHYVREIPVDRVLTGAISVGGGAAWFAFTLLRGRKPNTELEDIVRKALEPLARKERASEAEEEEEAAEDAAEDEDEAADDDAEDDAEEEPAKKA